MGISTNCRSCSGSIMGCRRNWPFTMSHSGRKGWKNGKYRRGGVWCVSICLASVGKIVTDGVVLVNIYARCLRVIRLGQCDPSSKLPKLRLIPRSPTGRRLISIAYVGRRAGYRELDTGVEYCDRFVPRHGEGNGCCSLSKSTGRPT